MSPGLACCFVGFLLVGGCDMDSVDDMSVDGDMDSGVVDVVVGCLKDVGLLVFRDGSMFDCYEIVVVGLGGCPNLVLYLDGDCFFNLELGTRFYLGDPGVFDSFLVFYNDRVSFMRSVIDEVLGVGLFVSWDRFYLIRVAGSRVDLGVGVFGCCLSVEFDFNGGLMRVNGTNGDWLRDFGFLNVGGLVDFLCSSL